VQPVRSRFRVSASHSTRRCTIAEVGTNRSALTPPDVLRSFRTSRWQRRTAAAACVVLLAACHTDAVNGDCSCSIPGDAVQFVSVLDSDCEKIAEQSGTTIRALQSQCLPLFPGGPCAAIAADSSLVRDCAFHPYFDIGVW